MHRYRFYVIDIVYSYHTLMKRAIWLIVCALAFFPLVGMTNVAYARENGSQIAAPTERWGSSQELNSLNCAYIESASLYRPCKRRFSDEDFDEHPQAGTLKKQVDALRK